jgi:two-component system, sensor histidine kinase and response regulator
MLRFMALDPRLRILVVDDEVQNLDTFRRVWRKQYDIATATSGTAGLDLLASGSFDAVLTDFGMPGMTGAEFVREARLLQPVAFVMVTGYADTPEVIALETSGEVFAVVGKPWNRQAITDVIARATAHTSTLRARENTMGS